MIYIITGGIDTGKTQRMISLYRGLGRGDGFVSKKIFIPPIGFTGYEIEHLSTGEKLPLAYKTEPLPPGWDEIYRYGPFSFSRKAFEFAEGIITGIISREIEPVFIDEIGPLELKGKGFFLLLGEILKTDKDLYMVVRSQCVEEVLKTFNIQGDVKILEE